jgi:hypothetical protein
VVGVYRYENNSLMPTTASEEDISTGLYVPVSSAKKITGSGDGYQYFTITTRPGTNSDVFMQQPMGTMIPRLTRVFIRNMTLQLS